MSDDSYTLMQAAYERFLSAVGDSVPGSELVRSIFFAGASAAIGALVRSPESLETIHAELFDDADAKSEADKVS